MILLRPFEKGRSAILLPQLEGTIGIPVPRSSWLADRVGTMLPLLLFPAFADDPLCDAVRPRFVEEKVEMARVLFEEGGALAGAPALAEVREAFGCVGAPIPADVLGTYAWLEAEQAILTYRPHAAWPWLHLARDLGTEPPTHLQRAHPLQSWLTEVPATPESDGPEATVGSTAGRRAIRVFVDGSELQVPRVRERTPHFVQVFEGGELVDTYWQQGDRFHGRWLRPAHAMPAVPKRTDTEAYWSSWLAANPTSKWRTYALEKLDALRFYDALEDGGAGLEAYLTDDPGANRALAAELIEPMELDRAVLSGSRTALVAFLEAHPEGRYRGDARRALDALDWEVATEQDTSEAYALYLTRHPAGTWGSIARDRLAARWLRDLERLDDIAARDALLARFPHTVEATRARALRDGIRVQQLLVSGAQNEELVLAGRAAGLRVERALDRERGGLPAGTAQVHTEVVLGAEGWVARAELWLPGGRAPVRVWTVESLDEEALPGLVAGAVDDLQTWVAAP